MSKPATKVSRKHALAAKRRLRLRKRIRGTAERPRLALKFTHLHIHAQAVDDDKGATLAAASTTEKEFRAAKLRPNAAGATAFGKVFGDRARKAGITAVVLDRGSRSYHGTVKAFSEAARAAGLAF
jgi:large subunit ribosomal protein L18